jgi:type IVB pilus formation R64 PilN family outer membrane protein
MATYKYFSLTALATAMVISGCSTFQQANKNDHDIDREFLHASALSSSLKKDKRANVNIHDTPWVDGNAYRIKRNRLPDSVNCSISLATQTPMPLSEFSSMIIKLCKIPLRVTRDAEKKVTGQLDEGAGVVVRRPQAETLNSGNVIDIKWQGKLDGLLDNVAASLGLSWKYEHGEVSFYYLESRTFNVHVIPTKTDISSKVQSGVDAGFGGVTEGSPTEGGGSSGQGQSAQNTSVTLSTDMSKDIKESIASMLTPNVGRISVSASTGTLTVTDTPSVLESVQRYLDSENKSITKQVLLNVKVMSVTLDDSNQFGIDWNVIYASSRMGASLVGAMPVSGGANLSTSILDGKFKDSQFLIDALSRQGKVSMITSPSVTTLNFQPVPVQVATQTSYLARVETTNTADVGSSTSLTPGTVTSGFNMNLLPFVLQNDQLLLQYSINLSELKDLKEVKSNDSESGMKIQVPEIDNRIFSQKVKLQSGQTLVLSGFEQTSKASERTGVGAAVNWLFGGGISAKEKRSVIVIMINPVVMD